MTGALLTLGKGFVEVLLDLIPITCVALFFQLGVLRRPLPNPKIMGAGFAVAVIGFYFILSGLEMGVYRMGETMAEHLAKPGFAIWARVFAFCVGYAATIAEPSLLAVALKAEEITDGALRSIMLRNAVALGVAFGLTLGVHRIFAGGVFWEYIFAAYVITVAFTALAPKEIVPLAYDSGAVTTSTVTVPLIVALGLGLTGGAPGKTQLIEGFGLIGIASVFPVITVLGYAIVVDFLNRRMKSRRG